MKLQPFAARSLISMALLGMALASAARADALGDLKARLAQISGNGPLKATVDFEDWNRDGDDKNARVVDGKVGALVEQTAAGLQIQWSRELLQQATVEIRQHKSDPEKPTPTRDAVAALSAYDLQQYFNSADRLLNILDQARLTGERTDTLDGKPTHALLYISKPALSEHDRKYVKDIEAGGEIWLDAEGYPLALEDHYTVHGSVMVVISFATEQHDEYRYARIGNYLVTTRHVAENNGSGGGEHGQSRLITTLQFAAPEVTVRTQ